MGCRLLVDEENGCCFYDSVTETAFGPVMRDADEADAFIKHLDIDPRSLPVNELIESYQDWRIKHNDDEETFTVCE